MNEVDLYRTDLRHNSNVSGSLISEAPYSVAGDTVDVLLWCPPGDNTPYVWAIGPAGTDFTRALRYSGAAPIQGPTANFPGQVRCGKKRFQDNLPGDILLGELTGTSVFEHSGATSLSAPRNRFFYTTYGAQMPRRWRTSASSITVNLDSTGTTNQGMVYAWEGGRQFADACAFERFHAGTAITSVVQPTEALFEYDAAGVPKYSTPAAPISAAYPFDNNNLYEVVQTKVTAVPFDENAMAIQTPHLYKTNAFHGAYVVHRMLGPDQPLQNTNDLPHTIVSPARLICLGLPAAPQWDGDPAFAVQMTDLQPDKSDSAHNTFGVTTASMCVMAMNACGSAPTIPGSGGPLTDFTGASVPPWLSDLMIQTGDLDTSLDNVSQSVILFRGINKAASLQITRHLSLEAAPLEESPARIFVTPPIDYDRAAMALYYEIAHRLEPVHPASANDFGDLVNEIAKVVQAVAPAVTAVGSLLAPEAAPFTALAGATVEGIATAVERATEKKRPRAPPPRPPPKQPTTRVARRMQAALNRPRPRGRR